MTIDLDQLEALAKDTTPEPWTHGEKAYLWLGDKRNQSFIATANPNVVLKLIAELRREREKYKYVTIRYQEECDVRDWLAQHFGKIEKCKTCKELPDDIITVNDCIQCIVEYARENVEEKED